MELEHTLEGPPEEERWPALDSRELFAVFCGGLLGAIARGALEQALPASEGHWPWATFAVNILAALLLGYIVTRLHLDPPDWRHARVFLASGICGALSTFSTLMLELARMLQHGHGGLALGYGGASIAGGLLAVFAAERLARRRSVGG